MIGKARAACVQLGSSPPPGTGRAKLFERFHLFDNLVGAAKQVERKCEAEQVRGFQVEDKLDSRRLLNGQIGWLFTLKNASNINTDQTLSVRQVAASIAHETTGGREWLCVGDCRQRVASLQ